MIIQSRNPYNWQDVVFETPAATADDVLKAAQRGNKDWWHAGPAARAAALSNAAGRLRARAAEAAELITREVGKPITESRGEVARAASILDFYAQACFAATGDSLPVPGLGLLYTERRPRGVAGLITPWNFPLAIPLWKAAPALAAGNAVLLKPSPDAIACAQLLAEVMADLPFTVLPGDAATGEAIVAHSDVISFTGSVGIGQQVVAAAAARGVHVQAEMGGQNAAIVLPDADPSVVAPMLAGAAMGFAGQKCTATSRIIIVGDARNWTEALTAAVQALAVGDPSDPATAVGPVINPQAHSRVCGAATSVQPRLGGPGDGLFVNPVLIDGIDAAHELAQTETFGPLAVILSAPDLTAAVEMANGVPHGLVTSIHGRDVNAILTAVQGIDTGLIRVNAPTTGVDFYAPFGGEKASSYGPREQGSSALDFYTSSRTITFGSSV